MDKPKYFIAIAGDVGTYKAALCKDLKKALNGTGISCSITMQDKAVADAFNVFVTTKKSEFHAEQHKKVLNDYDLVLDIDEMTEEEATQFTIERFAYWIG